MAHINNVKIGSTTYLVEPTVYGTCATAAATAAKVAAITGFALVEGATVHVKFTYSNTVANPTLNVNSTGAKPIMRYGTTPVSTSAATSWNAGAVVSFTYDGTNWVMNDWLNNNDNTTYSAGTGLSMSGTTINHSNSVTAGTAGTSSATSGSTLAVPYVTYDAQGHVTASGTHTHTVSGFAASSHTHSYAGSSSAGGAATSANKLNTDAGGMLNPVYFSNGVPVASKGNSIPFIIGTGTTAGTWTGTLEGLAAYYDGLLILYKSPVAGASTTTLKLNSLDAKTVYINNATKLTTHFPANQPILLVYSTSMNSGCWMCIDDYWTNSNTIPQASLETAAATAAKTASMTYYTATANSYVMVNVRYANSSKTALTLSINGQTAKPIFINGAASSTSNYTLPAGSYLVFYDGNNYYFRTDGKITGNITGDAATVNGKTVGVNVPADAKFTDTTYSSKTAASGGTDVSLVTTGEKYTWNSKSNLSIGTTATTAAAGNHTHATTIATSTGTNQITLAANTKYAITAGGTSYVFTTPPDTNTTYSSKAAASGGTDVSLVTTGEKYTWNNKSSLAIGTTATTAAAGNHTHGLSIATSTGTNAITLAASTKYQLTAGGSTYIFTTPPNTNTWTAFVGASASADGTAGYVPAPGKGNQAKFFRGDGTWAVPTDTNTNYYHTTGSWNGLTYTATANGGAGALAFTLPTGTTATTVAVGNHTHSGYLTSHQTIKQDGVTGATVNRYGVCTSAAASAVKVVNISTGTFSLEAGARVSVKFNNANTANTPTLNVNSTGDKNIFHKGAQITTGSNEALLAGVCDFIYDGTQWHLVGNYIDTNTQTVTGVKGNSESSYRTGNVNITAANIGLGSVDNTADSAKPVSTAQAAAIKAVQCIVVNVTASTSTSTTISNAAITANHVPINDVVTGTTADVTVTTAAGSVTIECTARIPAFRLILALPQ